MALDPALAPDGKETWEIDWRPASGQRVWLNPEEWLDVVTLRLEVDDPALFDLPATVDMDVEAWLPGGTAPFRRAHFDFSKSALSQELAIVMPEGQVPALRGRETFRRRGEPDFVREVPELAGPVHRIMSPFSQSWTMEVRAVADWTQTEALFAELRVRDAARQVWLPDEHRFTAADAVYTLRFSTSRETPRKAEARVTRIRKDGGIVRGPWTDLAGPVVAVTDAVKAERRVRATLSAPGYVEAGVRKAWVETTYQDPAHGVDASGRLDLNGDQTVADWVHPFPDPSRPNYRYRLRAIGADGGRYNASWAESAADDLDLTLPADPWDG
jgi:hypothetical protein